MLLCSAVIFILLFVKSSISLLEGELCDLGPGEVGTCEFIDSCKSVKNDLILYQKPPKATCGFDGQKPIVCCPQENRTTTILPASQAGESQRNTTPQEYGKVSSENCKNYSSLVLVNISSPILLPDVDYEIEDTCAIKDENYKENSVKAREFPHLVAIGYDSNTDRVWKCSGALISQQHVLTAATCSNLPKLSTAKYVRVGSTSVRENFYHEKPLQYTYIKKFIKHPQFNQETLTNNIAIVKLESVIKFTSIIRPGCLALNTNTDKDAISVGWGTLTNGGYMNNEPAKNLVTIKNSRLCSNIKLNQMCVEQPFETSSQSCLIDQGSPLQQYHESLYCAYNIIGILSEWKDCQRRTFGVYTSVSMYIPWIEKIVWG